MSKILRNIFVLSFLIFSVGAVCLLPSFSSAEKQNEIVAVAEESPSVNLAEIKRSDILDGIDVSKMSLSTYTGGKYGHSTVYKISSATDLAFMAYQVNKGESAYKSGVYSLEADIDLLGKSWTPIGTYSNAFEGKFYGNGKKIKNIVTSDSFIDSNGSSAAGLFGNISGASICDVVLQGSMVYNTSKTKGSLVGTMTNSEIINCYDECSKMGNGSTFTASVGSSTNSYVFRGGSHDGVTTKYKTAATINATIDDLSGVTNGYVAFYNISESNAKFFKANTEWYEPTRVRVLMTSEKAAYTSYTPRNNLYVTSIPVLRESAAATNIYPIKEGYKAIIPALNTFKQDESFIKTISFNGNQTINVTLNYGYGSGRTASYTFKYDQTFASYFTANPYMKIRAGYTFAGLYKSTTFNADNKMNDTGSDYKKAYPTADATYYFNWTAVTGKNVYFQFAIASDEGGVFAGEEALGNAVDASSFSQGTNGTLSTESFSNGKKVEINSVTSGQTVSLSFTLQDGYVISSTAHNEAGVDVDNFKADQTSGIYANFDNETTDGSTYEVKSDTNNDSYNKVSTTTTKSGNTYTITVNNIVGNDGTIFIVIARTEYEYDLTPIFITESGTGTIPYEWKLVNDASLTTEISGVARIDGSTLYARKYEQPILQITTKVGTNPSAVVIGIDSYTGASFNGGTKSDLALLTYYRTWNISTISQIVSNGSLKVKIGYLKSRLSINLVDLNGNGIDQTKNVNLGVSINQTGDTARMNYTANGATFIDMLQTDNIVVRNNGYYYATAFVVDGTEKSFSVNTDKSLSTFNSESLFTDIFEGGDTINHAVIIKFAVRTFNVNYEYYFGGVQQTVIEKLFKTTSRIGDESLDSLESLDSGSTIQIAISFEPLAKGILVFDKVEQTSGEVATGFASSSITTGTTDNTVYNYTLNLGTYDTTVKFYFNFREVDFSVSSMRLVDRNGSERELTEGFTTYTKTLTFGFDFAGTQKATLNGNLSGISISSQYYLLGWYLKNGQVQIKDNFSSLKSNELILADVVDVGASSAGTAKFAYDGVQALVGERIVNVKYTTGSVADADVERFYLNDKSTVVESGYQVSAGAVGYNEQISLSDTVFYKLGYTFNTWSVPTNGGSIDSGKYSISGSNWYSLYSVGDTGMQTWDKFSNQADETKEVVLTASWNKISYVVSIDSTSSLILKIGETISYTTDSALKNGQATYTIGANSASGSIRNGYVVVGYNIAQDGGAEGGRNIDGVLSSGKYGVFNVTADNFLSFINSEFRFVANTSIDPIKISTRREAAQYKIYFDNSDQGRINNGIYSASSENGYYAYSFNTTDTNGYGGVENGKIYINVTFDSLPTNLTNALSSRTLTVARTNYTLNGWKRTSGVAFSLNEPYTTNSDITIMPIWQLDDDAIVTASEINFTDDAQGKTEFYLTNSHDVLEGRLGACSIVDEGDLVTTANLILNNGDKIVDYGFEVTFDGSTTTYSKSSVLNIDLFAKQGLVKVVFFITLQDSLNTAVSYSVYSDEQTFTMKKNSLYFYEYDLHSVYNGTSEFVPATEEIDGVENQMGSFIYRYEWDGTDRASQDEKTAIGQTENYFNSYSIVGANFNAGHGKSLKLVLDMSKFGNIIPTDLFDNAWKDGNSYYAIIGDDVFEDTLTIERAKITISFPQGSTYYINDVIAVVYTNSNTHTFKVGLVNFEYTYSRITLVEDAPAGTYTGSKNYTTDSTKFVVESLSVKEGANTVSVTNPQGSLVNPSNFEWNISTDSTFELLDSQAALQLKYSTKYLLAENGEIANSLVDVYSGNADKLNVNAIKVAGINQTLPTNNQYSIYYNNDIVLSVAENNSNQVFVYVNKNILSTYSVELTLSINFVDDHSTMLFPLAWSSETSTAAYADSFDTSVGSTTNTVSLTSGLSNGSTYAVLTDAVKITLDYNSGTNASGNTSETIYVSKSAEYNLANPTYAYAGISFGGYTEGTLVSTSTSTDTTTFTVSKGGKTETLTAKWDFDSIDASLKNTEISRYASTTGIQLTLDELATIDSISLFSETKYQLKDENGNTYSLTSNVFDVKNGSGYAIPSMSGTYTLKLTFTFNDQVQDPQSKDAELTFTLNIVVNRIDISYNGGNLTYNNTDQAVNVSLDFTLNGEENGNKALTEISQVNEKTAINSVYVSAAPSLTLKKAGTYILTFKVVSDYAEIYQFENGTTTKNISVVIAKYEISLADYNDQINPSKMFGQDDPNPISSTITIEENENENVKLSFTRTEGESIGTYALAFAGIIDADDQNNYSVNTDGFEAYFEITTPESSLYVEVMETFSYTYNGFALGNFVVSYNEAEEKFILSATAGSENLSVEIDIYYYINETLARLPEEERALYASMFEFSSNSNKDAGTYNLIVALASSATDLGWTEVELVNGENSIIVSKRTITITEITKVFDQTASFVYNNKVASSNTAEIVLENVVSDDEIYIEGSLQGNRVGEHSIVNIALTNSSAINNYTLNVAEGLKATIIADNTTDISVERENNDNLTYGDIFSGIGVDAFKGIVPLEYTVDGISDYVTIDSIEIVNAEYSAGGFLNVGTYIVNVKIKSTEYTFGNTRNESLTHEYEKTISGVAEIILEKKEIIIQNSANEIAKDYDENAQVLASFLGQAVNVANGYYSSLDLLSGDVVTIVGAVYDNANVGTGKNITLTFADDDDSANYNIVTSVVGTINSFTLTLLTNLAVEDESLVTDGSFVEDGLNPTGQSKFEIVYPILDGASNIVDSLSLPTRTGYTPKGWKYFDGSQYVEISVDNIVAWLRSIAFDEEAEREANIFAVWEIDYYTISANGVNIESLTFATAEANALIGDAENGYKARYFSSVEISVLAQRGYKIDFFTIESGLVNNKVSQGEGYNTGKITLQNIQSAILFKILMDTIKVTFVVDENIPLYTNKIASNLFLNFDYPSMAGKYASDLGEISVTEGTYTFEGFVYGEGNYIEDENLQSIVDIHYPQLSTDCSIPVKATWRGEAYSIEFDMNGGTLESGSLTMTSLVYGQAITGSFPTVSKAGQKLTGWVANYNAIEERTYTADSVVSTVGEQDDDGNWVLTLTAVWENDSFELSFVIGENIHIKVNGESIVSGDKRRLVYGETELDLEVSADEGYEYNINTSEFRGILTGNNGNYVVKNITSNCAIVFEKICSENSFSLTLSNIEDYTISIDGVDQTKTTTIIARTESVVTAVFTAVKGYEFNLANITFTGSGNLSKDISDDKMTLSIEWANFVNDGSVEIEAIASDNTLTFADASDYLLTLTINSQSMSVTGGTFIAKTDSTVVVKAVLKYGYEGGAISTGLNDYIKAGSEKNTFSNTDKLFHYEAILENFDESFEVEFSAVERTYTFNILPAVDQESCGEITVESPQSVKFGQKVLLGESELRPDYIFGSWVSGDKILSTNSSDEILIDESQKDLLESVAHGQPITIYATYIKYTIEISISANNYGSVEVSQGDTTLAVVESGSTENVVVLFGQNVILKLVANQGYEIDNIVLDGVAIVLADYGFTVENQTVTIYEDYGDPILNIEVNFKASKLFVTVQSGTRINYQDYMGTSAGGFIYATDSIGNKLDDSIYLENDGNLIIGADYRILSYTDITLYFVVEVKEGFIVTVKTDAPGSTMNEIVGENGVTVYAFSGIKEDANVTAIFTAKENKVKVQFALEGETDLVYGGIITVDSSSNLVSASPNRAESIEISVVTSASLKLKVYSSLAYALLGDENGYLKYAIVYPSDSYYEDVTVGQLTAENKFVTGFTYSSTLEIDYVDSGATIYIYVEPQEYTINFQIEETQNIVMSEKVRYGEPFDLASLSDEEFELLFPYREGYTFTGYYTRPLSQGRQYINGEKEILSVWLEDGFDYQNGSYVCETNFDPFTNTYTLFGGWIYNKAVLQIQFNPAHVSTSDENLDISSVIANFDASIAWTTQYSKWYAEILIGCSLDFEAIDFEGYEFISWEIVFEDGDAIAKPENFTIDSVELGTYVIKAVYNPTFKIAVINSNNGKIDGGKSYLMQDGKVLTGTNFEKDKIVTLKAEENDGYTFLYWINSKTGEVYYGDANNDGTWTYTFESLMDTPLEIQAVFTGKVVSVNLDTSRAELYHDVRRVTVNGEIINFAETFLARVGDEIKIYVKKAQGYGFNFVGAPMFETYDSSTSSYVFSYAFRTHELTVVDDETYSINIVFDFVKEKLNLAFVVKVENPVDSKEYTKAGSLRFTNAKNENSDVTSNFVCQITYGDSTKLTITAYENYKVGYVILRNQTINDVSSWLDGNVLIINQDFIDGYFSRDITIEVYFQRLVWSMQEYRADTLEGLGTANNPFIIASEQEFALVAYLVNNGFEFNGVKYAECHYVLKSDLDFKGKYWEPIGTEENPFNGHFDLGQYQIKNVSHYIKYTNPKTSYSGLFWILGENATIKQDFKTTILIFVVVGVVVSLIIAIVIIVVIIRNKNKRKLHEIANS